MESLKLTQDEQKLIIQALDSHGDQVADRSGYSSGEPFWSLKDKLEQAWQIEKENPMAKFDTEQNFQPIRRGKAR